MQLEKLYIDDYKILKDFTIEFPYDFKKYISVFIGVNGSRKSTILEIIAQISKIMTLKPGDIIATGTPEGVSQIVSGDTIETGIDEVGILRVGVR